jgi:predicted N-acetyltransferase YhbS
MDLQIRPLSSADVPAADSVLIPAYGREDSAAPELRRYLRLQAGGWLLATVDGEPAGTVGAIDYGPFSWLGLLAVTPALQGRGIAKALMDEILAWLDARACPLVLLDASKAGAPLYPRYGFVDRDRVLVYVRRSATAPPGPRSGSVAMIRTDDVAQVAGLDQSIFGADRRAVLADLLAELPGRVFLHHGAGGQLDGYLIAQSRRLGPWVATNEAAADALLAAALTLEFAGRPLVLAPVANASAAALLARFGFRPQRELRHMGRGAGEHRARRAQIYGQASFMLG